MDGKLILTAIIESADGSNPIVEMTKREPGEEVQLIVTEEGFNKWTVLTGNLVLDDETATEITFNMPNENVTIIAEFD